MVDTTKFTLSAIEWLIHPAALNFEDCITATGLQTALQADCCTFTETLYAGEAPAAPLSRRA
jgi:hypothetical protein